MVVVASDFSIPIRTADYKVGNVVAMGNVPRSKIPVTRSRRNLQKRDGKNAGSCRNTPEVIRNMEAVFRLENFQIFPVHSDHFSVLFARNWSEITGENPEIFRLEYWFHVPVTSGVFLQDPAFFPSLSCRFLRDLVTGIFDLEQCYLRFPSC